MPPSTRDESEWAAQFQAARNALMQDDFSSAADNYQLAVEVAEDHQLGDERLAESLEGLATARFFLDKAEDITPIRDRASQLRDKLLAECEASLGPDHLEVAECLDRCAFHRRKQGKPSEAIALYQRAYEIRRSALGELHFDVANTLTIMASVYSMQERNKDAAAELWQRAVAILERLHDSERDNERVARSLSGTLENLAAHAYERGDFTSAEAFFRWVIKTLGETFGTKDPTHFCNLPTYATVLIRQRKYDEAENLLNGATLSRTVPEIFRQHLATAYNEALIELYEATGRTAEAEALRHQGDAGGSGTHIE